MGRAARRDARPARAGRRHPHPGAVSPSVRCASADCPLVYTCRILRVEAAGPRNGIPARRVGSTRALQLSRLGASGGRDPAMTTVTAQPAKGDTQAAQQRRMLREMLLIRRFAEKAAEAYALGNIGGFCHLYIGQEAVAVGDSAALGPTDYVIASYRERGQALLGGLSSRAVMAEVYGKGTGCSGGNGVSSDTATTEK